MDHKRIRFPMLGNVNRQLRWEFLESRGSEYKQLKRRHIRPFIFARILQGYGNPEVYRCADVLFQNIEISAIFDNSGLNEDHERHEQRLSINMTLAATPSYRITLSSQDLLYDGQRDRSFRTLTTGPQTYLWMGEEYLLLGDLWRICTYVTEWYCNVSTELDNYGIAWSRDEDSHHEGFLSYKPQFDAPNN